MQCSYFSPIQALGLTLITVLSSTVFIKSLVIGFCFAHVTVMSLLFSHFETKLQVNELIQGEVLREQTVMCQRIWHSANTVLVRRSLSLTPLPSSSHIQNMDHHDETDITREEQVLPPSAPELLEQQNEPKRTDDSHAETEEVEMMQEEDLRVFLIRASSSSHSREESKEVTAVPC